MQVFHPMVKEGGNGMHECPECGLMTKGAVSGGGYRSSLCPDCFNEKVEQALREWAVIEITHSFTVKGGE